MCGIAGLWLQDVAAFDLESVAKGMTRTLHHRGPDGAGVWVDRSAGLALGHRRLSILDLSPSGSQPMASACGRYQLVFNGEIYNHLEIRSALEQTRAAPAWRGHSDTEVMLAAIAFWGLEGALRKFVGMFAFALWDKSESTLWLARDRMGEKPLYFGQVGTALGFASELKALKVMPGWREDIDRQSLEIYLDRGYVPAPYSIYEGIHKVRPGTMVRITRGADGTHQWQEQTYWSLRNAAEHGATSPFVGSFEDATDELERLLRQSIKDQMVADVPVGAFLSGGVDSSCVVALMQQLSDRPINTFTIGVSDRRYDEAESARKIAGYLGTHHSEHYITADHLLEVVPNIPGMYDEPFSDSSQIPTYHVARFARQSVTVSLSGDGGDELFGGYRHYFQSRNIWRFVGWMPRMVRKELASGIRGASSVMSAVGRYSAGDRLYKFSGAIDAEDMDALHRYLMSLRKGDYQPTGAKHEPPPSCLKSVSRLMYTDMMEYLPDDILVKVDRSSMAVSLESRVPLLDHRIVEFAWTLPQEMKIQGDIGKQVLRNVLRRHLPDDYMHQSKKGFSIPVDAWLRGPLRAWAEQLLDPVSLEQDGLLDARAVRRMWSEHISGQRNWQHSVWNVLMFQAWLAESRKSAVGQ